MKLSKFLTPFLAFSTAMLATLNPVNGAEIFSTNFAPASGNILKNPKTGVVTALPAAQFTSHGNSNWSKVIKSDNSSHLRLQVGAGKYQDAIITTKSTALGFTKQPNGVRYRIKLGAGNFGNKQRGNGTARIYLLGKTSGDKFPNSWWAANNAIMIKFNASWIGLVMKNTANARSDKDSTLLWCSNYKGTISSLELLLTRHNYALAINGTKSQWNSKGAISGKLKLKTPTAFVQARLGLELKQGSKPMKPFTLDIKSLQVTTVESPK